MGASSTKSLHSLCDKGKQQKLRLAATSQNCNEQDEDGRTPLHHAANVRNETELSSKLTCAETLLNLGADPNLPNQMGFTPLFQAVNDESGDMIRLLVSKGADVNYVNNKMNSRTPLLWASYNGILTAVQLLLQLGANLNLKTLNNKSARDLALDNGHFNVVQYLDKPAAASVTSSPTAALPPNTSQNQAGSSSIQTDAVIRRKVPKPAIIKKHQPAAASVTRSPAAALPPNTSQNQAAAATGTGNTKSVNLHELCKQGNHQALKAAATANNCNQLDNDGRTPLSHAAFARKEDNLQHKIKCAEILLNLGADPNLSDQGSGTPLFKAIDDNSGDMIRLLVSKGADINYVSSKLCNYTPLIWASCCGKLAAVQLLIHLGARLDLKNSRGFSARDKAEENGHHSVAMCLDEFAAATGTGNLGLTNLHIFCIKGKQQELKAAATRNNCNKQNNEGRTPLHYAACVNNETELTNKMSCAQTLLNLGADPNLPNQMGSTPLFSAVATQSGDMIRLLLSNGADVNYVSSKWHKRTPLLYASRYGKVRAVPVLLQMGATLDLKDCMGRSARDLAEFFNHTEIVQCLDKFVAASVRSSPTAALPTNTSLTQLPAAASVTTSPTAASVTTSPTAASVTKTSQTQSPAAASVTTSPTAASVTKTSQAQSYYPRSKPQGICAIVNVSSYHSDSNFSDRPGSEVDVNKVESTFKSLHFEVMKIQSDRGLTANEIFHSLAKISRKSHSDYSSFVCFLMAHGTEGAIFGANGVSLALDEIQSLFSPNKCPSLEGKPKLFFVQACRGTVHQHLRESNTVIDSQIPVLSRTATPLHADFFIGFANVREAPAYRDKVNGSIFVRTLCSVLHQHYKSLHLEEIMAEVNNLVCDNPVPSDDGLYFQPVIERTSRLRKRMSFDAEQRR